ncbi:MAG: carboxylating nicotinate-nucleotide diphosphorylase [Dehalococcoidia bacterium]|nr:carboxylating nicotinate-nucleotide diphosphorylase [Dehalococcoidia bacterium]
MAESALRAPDEAALLAQAEAALREDGAWDDVTTFAIVGPGERGTALLLAREPGVFCGGPMVSATYALLDERVDVEMLVPEGGRFSAEEPLLRIRGPLRAILQGERVALNFAQRLSGTATLTRAYVERIAGLPARILDTRKTTPGLRALEKYAVRAGGGHNHRFGLHDGVLLKDNHLAAAYRRGLTMADILREARANAPHTLRIEVEVTGIDEARAALGAGADVVLLDNMTNDAMRAAVDLGRHRALFEASGGVTLERVRSIAETGVDFISVGALTHSARALDLSLELDLNAKG